MTEKTDTIADALRDLLSGWRDGYLRVVDVSTRLGEDSEGEEALYLDVVLPTPPPGDDTWPVDGVAALRRMLIDAARTVLGDDLAARPLYTTFRPESEEEQEELDQSSVATG